MGRKFGQHFLVNPHILDRLMERAAVRPGEAVLEIGPGRGALTERLLAAGARVTAVEIDPELIAGLTQRWAGTAAFRLIPGDILKTPLDAAELFGSAAPYAVIANLPYYLTTPLLFRFIRERRRLTRLLVMVQREVAERIAAPAASGHAYGSLSIAAQTAFDTALVLRVPATAFHPRPKVESAVVELVPRPPRWPPEVEAGFLDHVKGLFSQRRKLLAGTLRRAQPPWPAAGLEAALALAGERRPETLSPEEHARVYALLRGLPEGDGPSGASTG
jgi:16S rRNA (adenine1518-N6/adenine1519-N6)-dimethyltransferase